MAISNRDRVGRGLETLRAGLASFVERELKTRLRGDWQAQVERGSRHEKTPLPQATSSTVSPGST
jgi:hypothetical protein